VYNIRISSKAGEVVGNSIEKDEHLRLGARPGGCSGWKWELQTEQDLLTTSDDVHFTTSHNFEIVVSKSVLTDIIGSATIDYKQDNLVEQGFVIQRMGMHSCGCGESFTPIKDM